MRSRQRIDAVQIFIPLGETGKRTVEIGMTSARHACTYVCNLDRHTWNPTRLERVRAPFLIHNPMFSLALARRIARPPLATGPTNLARWYAATQANLATDRETAIHQKLTDKFKPTELHVQDISGEHCTLAALSNAPTRYFARWMWHVL